MSGERVERGGDWGGADRTEKIDCPMCGEEIFNNQLHNHLATSCDGGDGT